MPSKKDATPTTKQVELCRASYRAHQIGNELLLFASGVHPTTGFKEFFSVEDLNGTPPRFGFFCVKPGGIVLHVITPFQHNERIHLGRAVQTVQIEDADGKHDVEVEPFPEVMGEAGAVSCDVCVRKAIEVWANNKQFDDGQTLGQIYLRGSCNNGALSVLAQAIQASCQAQPTSLSCGTTARQLIRSTCP